MWHLRRVRPCGVGLRSYGVRYGDGNVLRVRLFSVIMAAA